MRYSDHLKTELSLAIVRKLGIDHRRVAIAGVIPWRDAHVELAIDEALDLLIDRLHLGDMEEHLLLAES